MRLKMTVFCLLAMIALVIAGCSAKPADEAIAVDIKAKMFSDPDLKSSSIEVIVKNGEVTLIGAVPNTEIQLKAYKLSASGKGVGRVIDQLTVQDAPTVSRESLRSQEPESNLVFQTEPERVKPVTPSEVRKRPTEKKLPVASPPEVDLQKKKADSGTENVPVKTEAAANLSRTETPGQDPGESTSKMVSTEKEEPPTPKKVQVEIPSGRVLRVRMVDGIDSTNHKVGEVFRATLDEPVMVTGWEVIPRKTMVFIELVEARSAGKMAGQSELELALHSLETGGQEYRLSGDTYELIGKSRGKDTALKVGVAAGIGTAIGAIAGGRKGAAIGAAVGGGSGVAIQAATRGQQVKVPTETQLEFRLKAPFTVPYTLHPGEEESKAGEAINPREKRIP